MHRGEKDVLVDRKRTRRGSWPNYGCLDYVHCPLGCLKAPIEQYIEPPDP
jgi:hypothetical protein